jgi:hypothetical protein
MTKCNTYVDVKYDFSHKILPHSLHAPHTPGIYALTLLTVCPPVPARDVRLAYDHPIAACELQSSNVVCGEDRVLDAARQETHLG